MSQLLQYYKSFQQNKSTPVNATPTFEDLSIDDKLSELERLVKYAKSSIGLQRLVHVKMLSSIASSVGYPETASQIIPLLEDLSMDSEPAVKQHLVEQLSPLAKFCETSGGEGGYQSIIENLLPITARLLEDDKAEVRQAACMTLVSLATCIKPDDIGGFVLTLILRLSHEDEKEEMRMTAAELLNSLAETLGADLCKQFVIPEIVSLAEDPVFRVRKSTALNFHNICRMGGEHELFERLMPAFVRLSKDDMYRVRRACAESLPEISKYVNDDIRLGVLVEIFLRLSQDPSRVVKQSVLQQSGLFIATLPTRVVNEGILSQYISMANNPTGDASIDNELKHFCAYTFPGVLQTVGKGRWKELKQLYAQLVQCRNVSVKQTLAASLHVVAELLGGGALVEEELVPVFEEMIQDVESVQMGVIKYLAEFLRMLSEPCRVSYLPLLHDILHSTNPFNWRLRQSLAAQLPDLILLPPRENLYSSLFPLVMTLLQDPVASVRRDSYKGVAKMILALSEIPSEQQGPSVSAQQLESIVNAINMLVRGETYQMRQLWVELAHRLLRDLPWEMMEKYFIDGVVVLACDPVCNVRLAVATLLAGWAPEDLAPWENADGDAEKRPSPWKKMFEREDIKTCVKALAEDDTDIYLNMQKVQPLFPDIKFKGMSCRGLKEAPGGKLMDTEGKDRLRSSFTISDDAEDDSPAVEKVGSSDDVGTPKSRATTRSNDESAGILPGVQAINIHAMRPSEGGTELAPDMDVPLDEAEQSKLLEDIMRPHRVSLSQDEDGDAEKAIAEIEKAKRKSQKVGGDEDVADFLKSLDNIGPAIEGGAVTKGARPFSTKVDMKDIDAMLNDAMNITKKDGENGASVIRAAESTGK